MAPMPLWHATFTVQTEKCTETASDITGSHCPDLRCYCHSIVQKYSLKISKLTITDVPNNTKKTPPTTGSGIVRNSAPNLVNIAKIIMNAAEY